MGAACVGCVTWPDSKPLPVNMPTIRITPPAAEPPPLIQPPRDPAARAQYEGEVQTLLLEAARLKAAGVPASDISRQMDPRLREINLRFRGR